MQNDIHGHNLYFITSTDAIRHQYLIKLMQGFIRFYESINRLWIITYFCFQHQINGGKWRRVVLQCFFMRIAFNITEESVKSCSHSNHQRFFFSPVRQVISIKNSARWTKDSVRLLLTKNCLLLQLPLMPGPRYVVWTVPSALVDSWPDIGPFKCCWLQLNLFLKRWGLIPELRRLWFACTRLMNRRVPEANLDRPDTA